MRIDLDALPDDAATLQEMLRTILHQQGTLQAENDKLRLLIQRLTRHPFGRRSEQLSPDQLQLGLKALEQTIAANQAAQDAATDAATGAPRPALRAGPGPTAPPATVALCRRTCRVTRWSSTSRTGPVPAAARC